MSDETAPPVSTSRSLLVILPVVTFAVLAAVFFLRLRSGVDPAALPSVLIGKPIPSFQLEALSNVETGGKPVPGLSSDAFRGQVTVVNFWASWCTPCQAEHPMLMRLARETGIRLVGIDYKDPPEAGRRFLARNGVPFQAIGVDATGRAAIDFGVYGVPETFVVGPDGIIRDKLVGILTPENYSEVLKKIHAANSVAAVTN